MHQFGTAFDLAASPSGWRGDQVKFQLSCDNAAKAMLRTIPAGAVLDHAHLTPQLNGHWNFEQLQNPWEESICPPSAPPHFLLREHLFTYPSPVKVCLWHPLSLISRFQVLHWKITFHSAISASSWNPLFCCLN